jgi:agarase
MVSKAADLRASPAAGRAAPSGYFHVEEIDGVWWLIDPAGHLFLSKGVNNVCWDPDTAGNTDRVPYRDACRRKYGTEQAWRATAARRLAPWGFNSLGAWSDEALATATPSALALAPVLDLAATFVLEHGARLDTDQMFPDVFDPAFERHAHRTAHAKCTARRDDPAVIGWFTDNELRWGPDWRGTAELLTFFLNQPPASSGRSTAIEMLRRRHGDFDSFNGVWRTASRTWEEFAQQRSVTAPYRRQPAYEHNEAAERRDKADRRRASFAADCDDFAGHVARRYFEVTSDAVRMADPNHLVLGSRFAYLPQPQVTEAAGRFVDVVSFSCYEHDPGAAIDAYAASNRPCLISEFSFRGADSGLPNTVGAGPRVPAQADRAHAFSRFATAALHRPTLVGYHWFEYVDQPPEGRFDGENSNFGVVTIDDDIYVELVKAMTAANREASQIHRLSGIDRIAQSVPGGHGP